MSLLIACILIYHFGLPWWMYLVAVGAFACRLYFLHIRDKMHTENMDGRFNLLNQQVYQGFQELTPTLNAIEEHVKAASESVGYLEDQRRESRPID